MKKQHHVYYTTDWAEGIDLFETTFYNVNLSILGVVMFSVNIHLFNIIIYRRSLRKTSVRFLLYDKLYERRVY